MESVKLYRNRLRCITDNLAASRNGVQGIKEYFYNFIEFSRIGDAKYGCLITNTANELTESTDDAIKLEVVKFVNEIRSLFLNNLKQDFSKNEDTLEQQANYLIISMAGLANATKMFSETQLSDYIELIFKNI